MTIELLLKVAQIIAIDVVLSGDNAVVIAMAAHKLPPVQRKKAIWWGGAIAILLRIAFTMIMAFLLTVPGVRLVGGIVLVWIACKLLLGEAEGSVVGTAGSRSTWAAIRMIFVADFVMSLDNMLAVAGAAGEKPWMIVMGLLVSIAIIMTCSAGIAWLMNKYHWIVYLGAGILAFTAGEMIMGDRELAGYFAREQKITLSGKWERDFMLTSAEVADFSRGDQLPEDLKEVVKYHSGELDFIGQMNERQRDQLLEKVESQADKEAIETMYETSHHREVPEWVPVAIRPRVENWFQRRWPAEVWKGVQGRQYNFVAWIFYVVVVSFCMTSPLWWRRGRAGDATHSPPADVNVSASGARKPPG